MKETIIGVDVAKKTLEVAIRPTGEKEAFPNNDEGIARLAEFLHPFTPTLVVLEAIGGLEIRAGSGST